MKLPSKIQFVDNKIKKAFEQLKSTDNKFYNHLARAFNDIEEHAFCGIQIPKRLMPKAYIKKYNVHNLWKYNLPDAWRLLYSIEANEIIVISIVLEWMDHKEYERRFNY